MLDLVENGKLEASEQVVERLNELRDKIEAKNRQLEDILLKEEEGEIGDFDLEGLSVTFRQKVRNLDLSTTKRDFNCILAELGCDWRI